MSAIFSADEILYATNSHLKSGVVDAKRGRIVWDLSDLKDGDWFIAIPSQFNDPHDSLDLALQKGARGLIVNRRSRYASAPKGVPIITVSDTKIALLEMMRYWRHIVKPRVIGVTGSNDRRSTMILLHQLLQEDFKTHVAFMNNLGWYGCVKEVFEMPADTEVLIFEAGAVERGDIARIGGALDPDLAVITQIRHPLATPERDEAVTSLYCELLETVTHNADRVQAVIYDDNPAVEKRAGEVMEGFLSRRYSQGECSLAERVPEEFLRSLSNEMESTVGLRVSRASMWCAVEAARAVGLPESTIDEILELDSKSSDTAYGVLKQPA